MPRVNVNFKVNSGGEARPVQLFLDTEQMTQRTMVEYFNAQQFYEPETSELLAALLTPGDTFIDVGGHVGYFSMLAAALVGPTGRVFTFEPERSNYERLLLHIAANKAAHVTPFPWAVGRETGIVELFVNQDNDGGHALWNPGLHPQGVKSRTNTTKVPTYLTRLDAILDPSRVGAVKLIKIDVEGNELAVLHGARELITRTRLPAIVLEINHFAFQQLGTSEEAIRTFMTDLQYETYLLQAWPPRKLAPGQKFESPYVFNLLFVTPQLQAVVADKWPQSQQQ